ncbi:MAG: ATP-binding cassette domain-containing protein [Anaerolineales bacterium]|nr:ATP-binding cassette domain-containing protein [Anaerolineales bacterium]
MEQAVASQTIELKHVTRRFGELVALDGLSFEVGRGEIFGLLGPNGAGKTTAINLICGLLRRHGGEIQILGFDPQKDPRQVRRRIGLVPQETNLYGDLSAQENLWHHAALYNADLESAGERIESLLRLLELWERRKDPVRTFSGGMKRRLALARALLHDPPLIFFDEPTLGVDVQGRHVLWEHIRAQQAQGKTFIVSTNDMAEADALCDRLVIIDQGKAIALDTPENLKAALGRDIVSIRTTPAIEDPGALFDGLGASAITRSQPDRLRFEVNNGERLVGELVRRVSLAHRLESIRVARPSLDDVFLHFTGRALRE